jgi:hypothetical protein
MVDHIGIPDRHNIEALCHDAGRCGSALETARLPTLSGFGVLSFR